MGKWFCIVNGQQYGPIDLELLRQWIAQGRVRPGDAVWTEGMAQWAPASSLPQFADIAAAAPRLGPESRRVLPASPGGTGGATPNAELTARARAILKGRWWPAIGFCLLWILLSYLAAIVPFGQLILLGPLTLGGVIYFLTLVRGGSVRVGMLFDGFSRFGESMVAYLLYSLAMLACMVPMFLAMIMMMAGLAIAAGQGSDASVIGAILVFLLVLLILIACIVATWIVSLMFAMTFFLLADNPGMGAIDALKASRAMMQGYKGKLFCLYLRMMGWALLAYLAALPTLGLSLIAAVLFLSPYGATMFALFYEDLKAAPARMTV
ncbi:MAG: DUF975 family protein [Planctomycetaceae bacterium]|nr:DUF975 family protein [Planctomycetaceae bacterium]